MSTKDNLYFYRLKLTRVVDGDTLFGDLDMGRNRWDFKVYARFSRTNAPEMKVEGQPNPAGEAAKAYLEELLKGQDYVIIRTKKQEIYGRDVSEVYRESDDLNLQDAMVAAGHAVYHKY